MAGERVLWHDAGEHTYTLNGVWIPGVTSCLKGAMRFAGVPADVLEAACARGTAGHRACELMAKGHRLDPVSVHHTLKPRIEAYERFVRDTGFVARAAERMVSHLPFYYAGQIDQDGEFPNEPPGFVDLLDLKFTADVPLTVGPQTAGYAGALADTLGIEMARVRRWCVHLKADGKYKLIPLRSANDWPIFTSALTLTRWCHDNRIEV